MTDDYGKFVFVAGKEAPAVPAKVEKAETGTVLEGEGADAEPSAAELAAKRREAEEARRAAEAAHAAAEAEERAEADRSLPAKLEEAAGETSEGADVATPAKTEKPADKEEATATVEATLEDIVIPAILTSPEFKEKGERFSASIEAAGKLLMKDFIESLSPKEKELLDGLGGKLKTLPSQEKLKTSMMAGQELGLAYMYDGKVEGRKTVTPFAKEIISAFRQLDENPDTTKKFTKFLESLVKIVVKETEKFYDSLSPEEKQGIKDFDKKIKTLPPDKQIQHYKKAGVEVMLVSGLASSGKEMYRAIADEPGFSDSFKMAMRSLSEHTDEAAEAGGEGTNDEDDEPEEEGKKVDKKEDDKPTAEEAKDTVVEAAKSGGFMAMLEKLIEKFGKLFEQIGNWFSEKFDGMTPKFKKSPIGGTEKFTISTAEKGVDLKTKKTGLDATWVKDSEAKVVDVGEDYVKVGNAEGIVTYSKIKPDVTRGAIVKPGAKLGAIVGDTLNLQMEDKDGKSEDPTSLLRGFVDKTETPDDKFPDFSAEEPPMKLDEGKKLPIEEIGADQKLKINAGTKTDVKMISEGTIKSVAQDGTVTISCKGKTEIIITGLNSASILAKKGEVKKAGAPLGISLDGVFTIQILKDGVPQDPYAMGMTDYLPAKEAAAETTAPAPTAPAAPATAPVATQAPATAPIAPPAAPAAPTVTPTPAPAPAVEAKPETPSLEQHRLELIADNLKDYVGKSTPISATSEFNVKLPFIENGQIVEVPCVIKGGNKVEVGGIKYDLELPAGAELTGVEIPELNLQDGTAILTASKFMFSDTAEMPLSKMLEMLDALRKGPSTLPVKIGDKSATFKKTA